MNLRNPGLFATANNDGTIAVHSIQSTSPSSITPTPLHTPANPSDIFEPASFADTNDTPNLGASLSLEKAPKFQLGRGLGSQDDGLRFTTVQMKRWRRKVVIKRVVSEEGLIRRAKELIEVEKTEGGMKAFVEDRAKAAESGSTDQNEPSATDKPAIADNQGWSALLALFDAEPKDSLVKPV
ncbi:protein transport protein S31 [Ceratobasidium sp. 414]|nr:protein transport protein S31 [Ceratobasidium sp. 414]